MMRNIKSGFEKLPIIQEIITDEYCGLMFEKLFKSQRSYRSSDKEAFIRGCEAAFKHQQSKVDELTKQRDSFIKAYEIEMDKSVDLQKRLDAALKMISINRGFAWMPESISQLEQVLKGGRE